jgi:D-alanyl-D-alanine carboxypeptidase/D-alanyl-D-alanine-endopeptidase (penicillin-binding protein 4)
MQKIFLVFLFVILDCLWTTHVSAQNVQASVDALVHHASMKNASISIHIQDLNTNNVVAQHDQNKSLIPASSLKLITTGVALERLGLNFKYETKLVSANNNIYILGSGDPTLGAPKSYHTDNTKTLFLKLADATAKAGIRNISGGVIAVSDAFDTAPVGDSWPWYDLGNYYAGGVWGLNIRENYYDLFLDQNSSTGKAPQCCGTDPEIKGLEFVNELTSGASNSGDMAYIYGAPYGYKKFIRGSIPSGNGTFTIKGSVPEPPLLAAQLLQEALLERNITTGLAPSYTFTMPNLSGAVELMNHYSPSLLDIIAETNRESINLYAEALLKTIGQMHKGKPGSFETGIQTIYDHLKAKNIDTDGLYMVDGSGMSPRNGISSKHFTEFLNYIFQQPDFYQDYKETLAVIGRKGTLKYLMRNEPIAGHLFGKSGSMERVRSYTGYVETQSGKTIAFSIIINNFAGKSRPAIRMIEDIFADIYDL